MVNNKGAVRRVNAREIDGWDEIGSGNWGGFELGQDLRRVNEETWDCGDAGVEKAFYSELGFVELLNSFHSVVFFIVGRHGCHGVSLSLSLVPCCVCFFIFSLCVCFKSGCLRATEQDFKMLAAWHRKGLQGTSN